MLSLYFFLTLYCLSISSVQGRGLVLCEKVISDIVGVLARLQAVREFGSEWLPVYNCDFY